ncbi:CHAT domain-containing protein [uncultured Mailhella sp.]|uniref:CHAT domain-containing protein n=1 Tax=uncultured Mailhella sp. TaxID=1981031 RepID=UPI00261A5F8A|nr:CHAT domain-containing protein [uncultured Mailhella sp.]
MQFHWILSLSFVLFLMFTPSLTFAGKLETTFATAQKAFQEKRFDDAAAGFEKAADLLGRQKQYAQAGLVLGNVAAIRLQQEKFQEAASVYEKILALPGKLDGDLQRRVLGNLAVCRHNLGEFALKADTLEKLLKMSAALSAEAKAGIYAQLGDAYRALEVYSPALKAYQTALQLLPAVPENKDLRGRLLNGAGLCASNLGDFSLGEKLLKTVLDEGPDGAQMEAEALSNLGVLKWEQGNYPEAAVLLKKALAKETEASLTRNKGADLNNYGLVLKSAGRYEAATEQIVQARDIARSQGNLRDEGIALSNLALLARITGDVESAKREYIAALDCYEKVSFKEGKASTLLGLGKIYETVDHDYTRALDCYKKAKALYEELSIPRGIAESLNQIGRALRKSADPKRTTRDLIFDDEEISFPAIDPAQALKESAEAFGRALELAEQMGMKELQWSAYQGLGFALWEQGRESEALAEYEKAIALVTAMRGSQEDAELLRDYLKDKGDLFTEAMELCSALFQKTNDNKYMVRAMELDEISRNELVKANASLVRMNYADSAKQEMYEKILALSKTERKLKVSAPVTVPVEASASAEEKKKASLENDEKKQSLLQTAKLEKSLQTLLKDWKDRYPEDAALFDSNAKINPDAVRAALKSDEMVLNYISLPEALVIVAIAKDFVRIYSEPVPAKELDERIKKDFLVDIIEGYGHQKDPQQEDETVAIQKSTSYFREMYELLMKPVEKDIQEKKRITIVASGFLAQFPFASLVTDASDPVHPTYLVESKDIVLSRLSFFGGRKKDEKVPSRLMAVGNPRNGKYKLGLKSLSGAENEVKMLAANFGLQENADSIRYKEEATETWVKNEIDKRFEIIYFATHGMPFSDTYTSFLNFEEQIKRFKNKDSARKQRDYAQQCLPGLSMLNGYLYCADSDTDDGFFTLKEIMEIPTESLKETQLVVLSACNTGVSFAPKSLVDDTILQTFSSTNIEAELRKVGWVPGVDQVSFVDTFMKRGVGYTYGSLWFADDAANAWIMPRFMEKLKQGQGMVAYSDVIREYIKRTKEGDAVLGDGYTSIPQHPYYWAVGAVFSH